MKCEQLLTEIRARQASEFDRLKALVCYYLFAPEWASAHLRKRKSENLLNSPPAKILHNFAGYSLFMWATGTLSEWEVSV